MGPWAYHFHFSFHFIKTIHLHFPHFPFHVHLHVITMMTSSSILTFPPTIIISTTVSPEQACTTVCNTSTPLAIFCHSIWASCAHQPPLGHLQHSVTIWASHAHLPSSDANLVLPQQAYRSWIMLDLV